MTNAEQIWKIDRLRDKVIKTSLKFRNRGPEAPQDRKPSSACMVEVLAPAGYHQIQRIADFFGVDFDEQFSNEYEWDRFRRELSELKSQAELDLRRRLALPEGTHFCLGYDQEGNFGLILQWEGREMSTGGEWMNYGKIAPNSSPIL